MADPCRPPLVPAPARRATGSYSARRDRPRDEAGSRFPVLQFRIEMLVSPMHAGTLDQLESWLGQILGQSDDPTIALQPGIFLSRHQDHMVPPLLGDRDRLLQCLVAQGTEGTMELAGSDPYLVCHRRRIRKI